MAYAKYIDLTDAAEKKKTIISGVLNPPSISINGSELPQKNANYSALVINNSEVKTTDTGGLQTFYEVVEGDQVLLQWKTNKNVLVPILDFSYPAVTKMELLHTEFVMQFNDKTKKAKYDGEDIDVKNPTIKVPSTLNWIETPHTLELLSEENIGRIYNLDFSKYKDDLLTMTSWSLSLGDPPLQGNNRPATLGVSSRVLNKKNYSHEVFAGVAHTEYVVGADTPWADNIEQRILEFKYKFGYNPFQTNSGDINYRRVTLGLHASLINYHRKSTYATVWLDGYNETSADTWFNQGGYFVRWEPLQYKNFGFFISIDHRVFRSQNSIQSDSTLKTLGVSYYFDPAILKRIISRQPIEF
ncbi:hypothetical protein [Pseudobdellovibrio sp. HCB154]|uniref:hypothetical protein n=1 Tax=Pseudobdellovibrio sp. HCB154 TaxID=3386277 RepID=UPI0039174B87